MTSEEMHTITTKFAACMYALAPSNTPQPINWKKVGSCLVDSTLKHYGLDALTAGSGARPTLYTLGNGLTVVNTYDSLSRNNGGYVCNGSDSASCAGGTALYGFTANWNGGRVSSSCDTSIGLCAVFGYDGFNRLASRTISQGAAQNFTYGYDRYGNRWQQNVTAGSGPQPQLSFDNGNHVTSPGTLYDAAGNMLNDGTSNTYVYDADGNILRVSGNLSATYVYDALNQKVSATTSAGTSEFTYDYLRRRLQTWNPSTNVATQVEVFWGAGKPFAYRAIDGTTYFQHADWLGTQRALTSYTGASAGTYQSLPFGDGFLSSGRNDNLTHFAGQDQNVVSGLSDASFRTMSNTDGRWMSPDPYSGSYDGTNPQSFNRYAYALNNPLNNIDPSGLDTSYCDPDGIYCVVNGDDPNGPPGCTPIYNAQGQYEGCQPNGPTAGTGSGQQGGQNGNGGSAPSSAGHIAGCFAKGAAVGAAGALVAGGLAVGAVTLGAPVAAVSAVLLLAGGISAGITGGLAINDIRSGNYASAAYGAGSLVGGLVAGGARASNTVFGMTGSSGTPFRGLASEASMFINPSMGPISGAFAKGPTQAGAAGATSGLGSALTWLGGCSK